MALGGAYPEVLMRVGWRPLCFNLWLAVLAHVRCSPAPGATWSRGIEVLVVHPCTDARECINHLSLSVAVLLHEDRRQRLGSREGLDNLRSLVCYWGAGSPGTRVTRVTSRPTLPHLMVRP